MLYPMYFQPETWDQANPVMAGMKQGQDLITQLMQNRILGSQAQLAPQTAQQDLLSKQLQNQTAGIQNQYLPSTLQSDIGLKQAQIPLTEAQTGLTNTQAQYFPLTTQANLLRGLGEYYRGMYYNNPALWASRFQNTPEFQNLIANNPDLAGQYTNIMANSMTNPMALTPMGMGMPNLPGQPGLQMNNAPMQPQANNMPTQAQQLPLNPQQINRLASFFPQSPYVSQNDVNNVQNAAGSLAIDKTVPKQIQQQRFYDQSVRNLMAQVAPDMPTIASYAGAAGKVKLESQKLAAALGLNTSPDYVKLNNFASVQAPLIANEARRAFGGQATDSEREVMNDLANPVWVKSNPGLAISHFNALASALEQNSKALVQTNMDTYKNVKEGMNNPVKAGQQYSQAGESPTTKTIGNNSYIKINGQWFQQ